MFRLDPRYHLAAFLAASLFLSSSNVFGAAIPVELRKTQQGWQLLRGGEPYFIRGAGGDASMEQLAAAGGNSIRTWGAEGIDERLDAAHALGLTVTVGIWLGHERHGFDYADETQVSEQFERARETVLRYKDHPALLLWGIGNEMEGFAAGDNPAIWKAVNDIAAMVKELDPNHPTLSVTAEIGGERIDYLHRHCPAIDIHGINSYGGAPSLTKRYRAKEPTKPYVLTEFGPPGSWETAKTSWDAPYEMTSTEKADYYRRSYQQAVLDAADIALGSYVFTWGYKMEATATWFGMFLPDGSPLAAVDAMTELWSGSPPANLAPTIEALSISGPVELKPRARLQAQVKIADPDSAPVRVQWVLRPESGDYMTGGDFRRMLPAIEDAIVEGRTDGARIRMPRDPGPYRLFVYAWDEAGRAAVANVPLLVKGKRRAPMPFYVYQDGLDGMPWSPSGWMGSTQALSLDGDHPENPYAGDSSLRLRFTAKAGWVAVAWQHPANNWGDQNGGFDLSGARYLELWARGEYGGERVGFGVGLLGSDTAHPDSGIKKVDGIVLGNEWERYRVPVGRMDLSSMKTGFVISISPRSTPVTVYLDEIRFVR